MAIEETEVSDIHVKNELVEEGAVGQHRNVELHRALKSRHITMIGRLLFRMYKKFC